MWFCFPNSRQNTIGMALLAGYVRRTVLLFCPRSVLLEEIFLLWTSSVLFPPLVASCPFLHPFISSGSICWSTQSRTFFLSCSSFPRRRPFLPYSWASRCLLSFLFSGRIPPPRALRHSISLLRRGSWGNSLLPSTPRPPYLVTTVRRLEDCLLPDLLAIGLPPARVNPDVRSTCVTYVCTILPAVTHSSKASFSSLGQGADFFFIPGHRS